MLTLAGLRQSWRLDPSIAVPYLLVFAFFPVIYYLTHPEDYYRRPIDPQYVVLAAVKDTPGSDQVSISRIAGLDRFTTALVLSNLIKRKLINRERSATDRRRYSLRLSGQGQEMLKRIMPGATRARARLLSPFTRHEQQNFVRALQQLVATLNDDARAPVDEDALPHMRRKADRIAKKK